MTIKQGSDLMSDYRKNILVAGILIVASLTLYFHAMHYYPFISDDSLISFRYAARFINGNGLTWTDGRPVEGYSNLLWVLLVAFFGFLGLDLIDASRLLGLISMNVVIISLLYWYMYRGKSQKGYISVTVGLFFFCMSAPIAVWAIGGLEQPLYAALIALAIPLTIKVMESDRKKTVLVLSFVLGLICITRPDGPLFSIAAFLSIYVGRFFARRKVLPFNNLVMLAFFPLLFYGGQLTFRLFYYGAFVPNTALVKIAPSFHHLMNGIKYIMYGMFSLFPFSLLALIFIVILILSPRKRSAGITLLTIMLLWTFYIVFVGGDIFPAYRHFIPIIVVFTFALVEGTDWILLKLRHSVSAKKKVLFFTSFVAVCIIFLIIQFTHSANKRAVKERWEWNGKVIGLVLKQAFSEKQPLIAVTAAGCLPYWSELPAIDMLGLNDYYLPRNPPKDFGTGFLGHELGNGNYVLQRKPDIIIFNTGTFKSSFRSGREMRRSKAFHKNYTPVKVRGSFPHSYTATLWFNKNSRKIGIQRTSSKIKVPGFLINGNKKTVMYANNEGNLVLPVHSSQPASVLIDSVTSKNWKVVIKASRINDIQYELQTKDSSLVVTLSSKSTNPVEVEEIELIKDESF